MIEMILAAAMTVQECDAAQTTTDALDEANACAEADIGCALADVACQMADDAADEVMEDQAELMAGPMEDAFPPWDDREVSGWFVQTVEDSAHCTMGSIYKDETIFFITFDAANSRLTLDFTNFDATSLSSGQKIKLDVFLSISERNNSGDDWDGLDFWVAVLPNGTRGFRSEWLDDEMLGYLAKHNLIAFFTGKVLVGSYSLDDSAMALKSLRDCAFTRAGLNPDDPFLK